MNPNDRRVVHPVNVHNAKKSAYGVNKEQATAIKSFNQDKMYSQGFRQVVPSGAGTTNITMTLSSPGKMLLGISIISITGNASDLADVQLSLSVNNNNILTNLAALQANPNYVQGIAYFPTPQPLVGTDTINMAVIKNATGAAITVVANAFYIPQ